MAIGNLGSWHGTLDRKPLGTSKGGELFDTMAAIKTEYVIGCDGRVFLRVFLSCDLGIGETCDAACLVAKDSKKQAQSRKLKQSDTSDVFLRRGSCSYDGHS